MTEYDQIVDWYAETRRAEVGRPDVEALASALPSGARVLDVGCGTGVPIAQALVAHGAEVVGLDSSSEMIARFRTALPDAEAHCERIQDASFPPASFDAVVAWGVLFHLSASDQQAVIPRVSSWLKPGGTFLFTSGAEDVSRAGEMDGVTFTYRSLGEAAYRQLVEDAGLCLVDTLSDPWDNHVYRAHKPAPARAGGLGASVRDAPRGVPTIAIP